MSNRDVDGALKWMRDQSKNPTQSWKALCQSSVRQSYKMPAWAGSANDAWRAVDKKYRHTFDYRDKEAWAAIPAGGIVYSIGTSKYGHAWLSAGNMQGWTVDYVRSGKIDLADIRLTGWSNIHKGTVGWIDGCQWYSDNKHRFKGLTEAMWDGHTPDLDVVMKANEDRTLASSAAWRLACRLHDLGYFKGTPVRYEQTYPVRAMEKYNAQHGPNMPDPSQYGPKAHERIFGK